MRTIYVTHFAERGNLTFTSESPKPQLDPNSNDLLVRVLACALNPGDCRLMNGSVSLVMKPSKFPYIPGIDLCGVVEAVGAKCTPLGKFKVGDRIIGSQDVFTHGSFAEYALINSNLAALAPPQSVCSDLEAASLPVAGCTAVQAIKDAQVGPGSRVLVIGGSGGVGSLVIQLAKLKGATFVATTSTNTKLVGSLGADLAINYREADWWDVLKRDERDDDQRLDAIIDCVGDDASWRHCDDHVLKKRSGRYIAVVDAPNTQVRTIGDLFRFIGPMLWRSWNPFTTSYKMVSSFPKTRELEELVALLNRHPKQQLHAVLDASSPFELTLEDMERAVALQTSQRAKGKLVFRVSEGK